MFCALGFNSYFLDFEVVNRKTIPNSISLSNTERLLITIKIQGSPGLEEDVRNAKVLYTVHDENMIDVDMTETISQVSTYSNTLPVVIGNTCIIYF